MTHIPTTRLAFVAAVLYSAAPLSVLGLLPTRSSRLLLQAWGGATRSRRDASVSPREMTMLFDMFKPKPKPVISDAEAREKYGVQLPKYESLERDGYELRKYQDMCVVECTYDARPEGYELLGAYTGGGENALGLPMPQTCPAVMRPCLEPAKKMFYMLPSPHTPLEPGAPMTPAPLPSALLTECGVEPRTIDGLTVAVAKFSGYAVPDVVFGARDGLKAALRRDGIPFDESDEGDQQLMLAQYNELFSLPWNRDNEVWLPVTAWPQ